MNARNNQHHNPETCPSDQRQPPRSPAGSGQPSKVLRRLITGALLLLLLLPLPATGAPLQVKLTGVSGELEKHLSQALTLPAGMVSDGRVNSRWLRRYSRQLPKTVSDALEPLGYFHSRASGTLEETQPGEYLLKVQVDAGEPLQVTSRQLQLSGPGQALPELQTQLASFPLQVGEVLRQDLYEQGRAELKARAVALGFLDAAFTTHQLLVHRGERRAEIQLTLATGPRYRFGSSRISGQGSYPERFLQRYLDYQPGEVFSQAKLGQTQANLLDADLFRSISITPRPEQAEEQQVPIDIELQPAPRHRLRPGIGYGTDTGARTSLRYRNLNLFDLGHELQGDLLLAERQQSLVTSYIIPDPDELHSQTQLRVGYDREDNDTYESSNLFGEIEWQKVLGRNLLGSAFVRLTQEESEIAGEQTRSQLLLPGARLTWRSADNLRAPQEALQVQLELRGASEALLSDTSLLQFTGSLTRRQPLPADFSLLLRLQGGTSWQDELRELPASLRFFAGGDRSVRGYRYQSLGPKDADGQVIGGKHLLTSNFELEKRFSENWGGAIFYDLGNAFDSFADYELEQGAGLGIRRYTRIGPIRLDLARQLGTDKGKYRLHLSVGFGW